MLAALLLSENYWLRADGFFTLLVGSYLLYGAIKIVWISVNHLMDHELPEEETAKIKQIVDKHPHALGLHDLRTRQAGNMKFIQFHLEFADHLSFKRSACHW